QLNARLELSAEHGHRRKTHPTGGPGPGKLVEGLASRLPPSGGCGDKTGPPAEGGIKQLDVLRACPLLGAVDGCGTLRTGQWVVDVARHDEPSLGQPRIQAGQVNSVQSGKRAPAAPKLFTGRVEQRAPPRLPHPGAPIGAGASPDAEHDRVTSELQRGSDDLASTVRAGL